MTINTLMVKFVRVWNNEIKEQDEWRDMILFCMFSMLIDKINRELANPDSEADEQGIPHFVNLPLWDARVSVIFKSPTGTAKDAGANYIKATVKQLNIPIDARVKYELYLKEGKEDKARDFEKYLTTDPIYNHRIVLIHNNDVNDAVLTGTYEEDKARWNRSKGLFPGDIIIPDKGPDKGKELKYKEPIKKGMLLYADLIISTEAMKYFKSDARFNEQTTVHIREALSKERYVSKALAKVHGINGFSPSTMLLATQPNTIDVTGLIHDGTYGRFGMTYTKHVNEELSIKIEDAIIQNSFSDGQNNSLNLESNPLFHDYISELREVLIFYKNNHDKIKFKDGLTEFIKNTRDNVQIKIASSLDPIDNILFRGYFRRGIIECSKLTKLNAIMRKSLIIEERDFAVGWRILEKSLTDILITIREMSSQKKEFYVAIEVFRNLQGTGKTSIGTEAFKAAIISLMGYSDKKTGKRIIENLSSSGIIEPDKSFKGRGTVWILTDRTRKLYFPTKQEMALRNAISDTNIKNENPVTIHDLETEEDMFFVPFDFRNDESDEDNPFQDL